VGDTTYTTFGLQIARGNGGANAASNIIHRGTGTLTIETEDAGNIVFQTAATTRLTISSTGGVTSAAALQATTYLKAAPTTVAGLGTCTTALQGARWTVTDANSPVPGSALTGGGSTGAPAFCTGSAWIDG
jgi:hypothetical protein